MKETSLAIDSNETVIQSVNTINTIQETRVGDPSEDRTLDNDSILYQIPVTHHLFKSRSPSFQLFNQSRSQQSSSTGRNRFSVQSNLEAWLTPSLHPTSRIQNTTPTPSLPQHTTNTSSSSHSPIESVPSSTPSESVIPSTPAFINPEFAPSSASTGSPSPAPSAPSTPIKRTALKLAKQLRNFQGCTHEQHETAEQLHREHHQEPDIHSECSSLQDITTLLKGDYPGGVPLPDVLSNHKLLQAGDYNFQDFQAAFEGVSTTAAPEDDGTRNENLPKNLCFAQHHLTSKKNREAKHYPASARISAIGCYGYFDRGLRRKESSREQLVKHTIQPQYLDRLWDAIVQSIEDNPASIDFERASIRSFHRMQWVATTDTQFYNPDRTFVDLAKQVTSQDTALPFDHILTITKPSILVEEVLS
ncbi:hypothetical protein H4I95_12259 [Botrytis cinerea]